MILLIIPFCLFFYFFNLEVSANTEELNDNKYYQKGVTHYDDGEFKKSYIVFFNLSQKGHKSSIHNLSNMYFEGIGTTQDYQLSLKYTWLCSLNGNKKCINKVDRVLKKVSEDIITKIKSEIEEMLEKEYIDNLDEFAAFKLAYWHENFSPEINLEKSYLWYSVAVSSGNYKAMKFRDRVGESLENEILLELQKEAFDIFTKQKYLKTKNTSGDSL